MADPPHSSKGENRSGRSNGRGPSPETLGTRRHRETTHSPSDSIVGSAVRTARSKEPAPSLLSSPSHHLKYNKHESPNVRARSNCSQQSSVLTLDGQAYGDLGQDVNNGWSGSGPVTTYTTSSREQGRSEQLSTETRPSIPVLFRLL